jgi:hypothetical protein
MKYKRREHVRDRLRRLGRKVSHDMSVQEMEALLEQLIKERLKCASTASP